MKIPFTNSTHEPVKFACCKEPIAHNAEQISCSGLAIVAKEKLYQLCANVWSAIVSYITLEVRSICKRKI